MTSKEIYRKILQKKSCLCIGLDPDPAKMPGFFSGDPDALFHFNRAIIEATSDLAVSYKPNLAFYEAYGPGGLKQLEKTVDFIRTTDPSLFIIADAKRGDIGNTAAQYARSLFIHYDFDAVTLSPYMGRDSIEPFLQYPGRWAILLGLTSNPGAGDLQLIKLENGEQVYHRVIRMSTSWGNPDNLMYVVGATQAEMLSEIREIIPDHFLLLPGVGAQGGSIETVMTRGLNRQAGLLINSSRAIIHAGQGSDFTTLAREAALSMKRQMEVFLK
ncbi:MAG: orotidine-5'-phosphate decarboxylase [Bacteroidales bacterium]|nr:orotidine-5'-phosphate decarboxylase [Bacteroidales bacterium]